MQSLELSCSMVIPPRSSKRWHYVSTNDHHSGQLATYTAPRREPPPLPLVNDAHPMNAVLILNEAARSLRANGSSLAPPDVIDAFRSTVMTVNPRIAPASRLGETLKAVVAEKPDVIIVGGGDGSVSTAADCLVNTNIALGVLPLGTLNHFARDLGVPLGWRDAVESLADGEVRAVDVGEVNGRVFINNCSIGSYADAVRKRDALRRMGRANKWWAMALATIAVFRRLRRIRVRIDANGETFPFRTPFVVVANNRYSGRVLDHSLRSRLDEGRLWIYTTRATRHGAMLHFIWQSLIRTIDEVDGLEKFEVTHAAVHHEYAGLPVAIDGELVALQPPLRFRSRPGALRVLVPRRQQPGA
jgi:diacylglycerol kinase family enzyme